jgi:CHAT domain-containing protein
MAIKAMSADDRLARARVVHFATHGLVAGEVKRLAEPALVLTPPGEGTDPAELEQDDGLLTASEVAQLKLNADWVILSACNTAAGDGGDGEALSGLARAFFYAGARAQLVSHWPLNSDAAVKLTTRIFEQKSDVGRAGALRAAMLATIDEGGRAAHPSYWAPFVVVGEGRAPTNSLPRLTSQPALIRSGTLRAGE